LERIVYSAERLEMIEAIKQVAVSAERAVAGLSDSVLRQKEGEGPSIKEALAEMAFEADKWAVRLRMVASQTDPVFKPVEASPEGDPQEGTAAELIADLKAQILAVVKAMEETVDWTRVGQHPRIGRRSFRQWTDHLLALETEHLRRIEAASSQTGATRNP
jgi:hypothetical protein